MKLFIMRKTDKEFHEGAYYIGTYYLKMKSTHFFIASNKWESIYLELEDEIPEGYLRSLHLVCSDIKVNLPEVLTDKTFQLLAELYPTHSGAIRKARLTGHSIKEVLGSCMVP